MTALPPRLSSRAWPGIQQRRLSHPRPGLRVEPAMTALPPRLSSRAWPGIQQRRLDQPRPGLRVEPAMTTQTSRRHPLVQDRRRRARVRLALQEVADVLARID